MPSIKTPPRIKPAAKSEPKAISISATRQLEVAHNLLGEGFKALAGLLNPDLALAPADASTLHVFLKDTEDLLAELEKRSKAKLLAMLQDKGTKTTDKGSLELQTEGWVLQARPWRTGLDAKKVEALLRAKGIDPGLGMDQTISYSLNPTKLQQLQIRVLKVAAQVGAKDEAVPDNTTLTDKELDSCKYELSWALQKPKKVEP